jgi:hypothetical protein
LTVDRCCCCCCRFLVANSCGNIFFVSQTKFKFYPEAPVGRQVGTVIRLLPTTMCNKATYKFT